MEADELSAIEPLRDAVLIATGSHGSGKTTLLEATPPGVGIKVDEVFTEIEAVCEMISNVLDSGRRAVVECVFVDDPNIEVRRMLSRATGTTDTPGIGRVVPIEKMAEAYVKVPEIIVRLWQEFADRVLFLTANNSLTPPEIVITPGIADLVKHFYEPELLNRLRKVEDMQDTEALVQEPTIGCSWRLSDEELVQGIISVQMEYMKSRPPSRQVKD